MSAEEIKGKTDSEIQELWNELARVFEGMKPRPRVAVVGFFELSRETERRNLVLDKDKFGKIILKSKP